MPALSAAMRNSTTSSSRKTGAGSGPNRSTSFLAERGQLAGRSHPPEAPVELELLRCLRHVFVRQMGVHRQVDDGAGPFDVRRPTFELGLLLLDRFGQETRIEVEAHRRYVAVLLGPRMLPAPRISRSERAIWKPAPSSER